MPPSWSVWRACGRGSRAHRVARRCRPGPVYPLAAAVRGPAAGYNLRVAAAPPPPPPGVGFLSGCGVGRSGGGGGGRPQQQPAHPQCGNYWAPLTRKRHIPPHPAQPQHTDHWAPRTRKQHQQEHRPQRPTERSDPTQHAKGRTPPGPRFHSGKY